MYLCRTLFAYAIKAEGIAHDTVDVVLDSCCFLFVVGPGFFTPVQKLLLSVCQPALSSRTNVLDLTLLDLWLFITSYKEYRTDYIQIISF
jgi:hypothetical protein